MTLVTIDEAKTHLGRSIDRPLAGEDVFIEKHDKRLIKLVPVGTKNAARRFGGRENQIWMADDFDASFEDFENYS